MFITCAKNPITYWQFKTSDQNQNLVPIVSLKRLLKIQQKFEYSEKVKQFGKKNLTISFDIPSSVKSKLKIFFKFCGLLKIYELLSGSACTSADQIQKPRITYACQKVGLISEDVLTWIKLSGQGIFGTFDNGIEEKTFPRSNYLYQRAFFS